YRKKAPPTRKLTRIFSDGCRARMVRCSIRHGCRHGKPPDIFLLPCLLVHLGCASNQVCSTEPTKPKPPVTTGTGTFLTFKILPGPQPAWWPGRDRCEHGEIQAGRCFSTRPESASGRGPGRGLSTRGMVERPADLVRRSRCADRRGILPHVHHLSAF